VPLAKYDLVEIDDLKELVLERPCKHSHSFQEKRRNWRVSCSCLDAAHQDFLQLQVLKNDSFRHAQRGEKNTPVGGARRLDHFGWMSGQEDLVPTLPHICIRKYLKFHREAVPTILHSSHVYSDANVNNLGEQKIEVGILANNNVASTFQM